MARNRNTEAPPAPPPADGAPRGELIVPRDYANSRLIPAKGTPMAECPTSLDMTRPDHFALAFNAMGAAVNPMANNDVVEMDCEHWICHWRELADEETGEIAEYPCLTLIAPDGSAQCLTSDVVRHRFADLLDAQRLGRVTFPIRLRVRSSKSRRSGRTYHQLEIVHQEEQL